MNDECRFKKLMKLPELNQHLNFDEKLFQIFNLFMDKVGSYDF